MTDVHKNPPSSTRQPESNPGQVREPKQSEPMSAPAKIPHETRRPGLEYGDQPIEVADRARAPKSDDASAQSARASDDGMPDNSKRAATGSSMEATKGASEGCGPNDAARASSSPESHEKRDSSSKGPQATSVRVPSTGGPSA